MVDRLTIVEDHGLMASTLGTALATDDVEVAVVRPAQGNDVVAEIAATTPEVVLLDLDLGAWGHALPLIRPLRDRGLHVLMVTGVTDPIELAACTVEGAAGIVDKAADLDELLDAIERVGRDGTLLTEHERAEHLSRLRTFEQERRRALGPFETLTPREAEVLGELMAGHTVDQIASNSVVSKATVRTQVTTIRKKLGVSSQVAAIGRAREVGWTPPQERAGTD